MEIQHRRVLAHGERPADPLLGHNRHSPLLVAAVVPGDRIPPDGGDHDRERDRDGGSGEEPAPPSVAGPRPLRSLPHIRGPGDVAMHLGHDAPPRLGRSLHLLPRPRQNGYGRPQRLELTRASSTRGSVCLDRPSLAPVEPAERVGDQVISIRVLAGHSPSASVALILSMPRRMRPFTVPSGSFSISAISEWLKPPK